jgi:hypothetical protein
MAPGTTGAQTVVLPPTFAPAQAFFDTASLSVTLTAPAGTIRYTLDGATPTSTSGTLYSGPFSISNTTVVRAVAYTGAGTSTVALKTYIRLASVRVQSNTPLPGWPTHFSPDDDKGTYPADYEMDHEITDKYSTDQFDAAMKSLPSLSIATDLPNLWDTTIGIYANSSAKELNPPDPYDNPVSQGKWERPMSVEWINPDGTTGFSINGGMRIHGQASRRPNRTPKKSFRLYFKKGYGNGSLDFTLFNDAAATGKFDRLVLRNGGNRSWPYFDRDQRREADYVNDEWARQVWEEMGHLTSHGTYVHLYIDGVYWGLSNVAERIDEKFLAAYHPGLLETDFDLIESEEDLDDAAVASAGTIDAYNELLSLVNPYSTAPITDAQYQVIETKVDVENLADYFILNHYIGKTDWPDHNFNLYRARTGPDTRFKFIPWDNDSGLNKVTQNTTAMTETLVNGVLDAPLQIFNRLTTNQEFLRVVNDRFYKNVIDPTGKMAPANCAAVYTELTGIVDQAVIAESARWGDYMRDVYPATNVADKPFPAYLHSRDLPNAYTDPAGNPRGPVLDTDQKNWLQVRSEKLNTYCPNRANFLWVQYDANQWIIDTLQVPGISQRGGTVSVGNPNVSLDNAANNNVGDIYYTTNGVDPRTEFGGIAASATNTGDAATIMISRATTLKARVRNGNDWSALLEYNFAPTQAMSNLVVNELHYFPAVPNVALDPKQYEFVELYNKGTTPLQLDRVTFSRGVTFTFPANTTIQPNQYIVLASNSAIFQSRYGFAPYGVYNGSLANEGESVELLDAVGTPFTRIDYKTVAPWPTTVLGTGPSLSLKNPTLDSTLGGNWAPSTLADGTPGGPNFGPTGQQVPAILWTTPSAITYGTALSAAQLNATLGGPNVAGTFSYNPPLGTILNAGYGQQLNVTFTPDDTVNYATATATTFIDVLRAPLTITADSKAWRIGTTFPQLTVTYSGFVNGDGPEDLDTLPTVNTTATPSSPEGTYPISATGALDFNYSISYVDGTFTATTKNIPTIDWPSPAAITFGTPLGTDQLNATASFEGQSLPGTFSYTPAAGTVLPVGTNQVLQVIFTPTDTSTYATISASTTITVVAEDPSKPYRIMLPLVVR